MRHSLERPKLSAAVVFCIALQCLVHQPVAAAQDSPILGKIAALFSSDAQVASGETQITAGDAEFDRSNFRLELVGGYRIPNVERAGMNLFWGLGHVDRLSSTGAWLLVHPRGYLLEFIENSRIGTGKPATWPQLKLGRDVKAMSQNEEFKASAAFWLDADTVLVSARKHYRAPFSPQWMARVNFETGEEETFSVFSRENTDASNFHLLQSLGSGFVRLGSDNWVTTNFPDTSFLIGRGGYDVLNSPLGPALGYWRIGDSVADILLDFPLPHRAPRDPYYAYPKRHPGGGSGAQLPMWLSPEGSNGYWQAGDVGGIAYVNHPRVHAFVATHNFARGLLDYRSQGGPGTGQYFLVKDPSRFYSEKGGRGRGGHRGERGNREYPWGVNATALQVIDPEHLVKVKKGDRKPWETSIRRFDWTREGLESFWSDDGHRPTEVKGLFWDEDRQLLWAVMPFPYPILAAYRLVAPGDGASDIPAMPSSWRGIFDAASDSASEVLDPHDDEADSVRPEPQLDARERRLLFLEQQRRSSERELE